MKRTRDERVLTMIETDREIFLALEKLLSPPEQRWLTDTGGRYDIYQDRLRQLARHHRIAFKESRLG